MLPDNKQIQLLASTRTNDFSEPIDLYLQVAKEFEATLRQDFIARAKFILEQCIGDNGKDSFDKYREDWNINNFDENILTVEDFKRGFLWKFRDHRTSWNDNQKAKTWFLNSTESLLVRRYEFWTCDKGYDECIEVREGTYKEILLSLLQDGNYEVLSSSSFSRSELNDFIKSYAPKNGEYTINEIIEDYIETNPNYVG